MHTHLTLPADLEPCRFCSDVMRLSGQVTAAVGAQARLAGFVLYVGGEVIATLESDAYDGPWPDDAALKFSRTGHPDSLLE